MPVHIRRTQVKFVYQEERVKFKVAGAKQRVCLCILFVYASVFSERELMFMFAICRRPSVCRLSVTFVHPTQPIKIFGNVSMPFNTLVT